MTDIKEQIAIALWHRFAPEGHMEWSEERHAAEYRDAADSVLFLARSSLIPDDAQLAVKSLSFMEAMNIVERGFDTWKDKPHNAKWYNRIDGTPIPNDLRVNIAEAICHSDEIARLAAQPPAAQVETVPEPGSIKAVLRNIAENAVSPEFRAALHSPCSAGNGDAK